LFGAFRNGPLRTDQVKGGTKEMADFSQKGRYLGVKTPLGEDVLLLEGFSGREAISRPFHFTLELLSEDPAVDPEELIRQAVTVSVGLPDGSTRVINGRVARFTQLGQAAILHSYSAQIVPWLWFLSLSNDCRIFQKMNVLDIIKKIFADYPDADFSVKCMGSYPPRDYCVQYRESDLDFVSRLMAEEGIFFFFEHSESGHKLIIADDPSTIPPCAQSTARVNTNPAAEFWDDVINRIEREMSAHSTAVSLTDYDDLQPSLNLMSSASVAGFEEVYDYPGKFSHTSEGERYAKLRLEALSNHKEVLRGTPRVRAFESGHKFTLSDHPVAAANQEYLLLSVAHEARDSSYRRAGDGPGTEYSNRFECIPASVTYRPPPVERRSAVPGSQTAVVVGPSGEEIYTDPHGKVKIQFHWDREGKKDENSSCWVRVSQPWAGKAWGAVAIPRIGQEVIVDFLEGDPDRPIITGRVYNKIQSPPYDLPANKTQTGIKSRSSKDGNGANFNEIRMEDKKGSELLYIHAEKDKQVVVENDRAEQVGHDEAIEIGNDRTEKVGNDENIGIGNNRSISVGKDESITVGSNQTEVVSGDQSMSVGGNRGVDVGKNHSETIGGSMSLEVGKDRNLKVGGNLNVKVGKAHKEETKKGYSLKAEEIFIEAKKQLEIKVGSASFILKKNGDIQLKGKKLNIKGSGDVVIKGSKIAEN
jgi:type VI secretion system secreted protein VgrG